MITGDIKKLLSINIKSRYDSFTDQYSRIFMVKIMLVCSMIMGISWFKDSINCIVTDTNDGLNNGFVSSSCWIQGIYVYKEMESRIGDVSYFGIPKEVYNDGLQENPKTGRQELCRVYNTEYKKHEDCQPMTKIFYLQYQWMPFYVATLCVFYYLPYVLFRYLNADLVSLKATLKSGDVKADAIVQSYFNSKVNPKRRMKIRVYMNILVKLSYLVINVMAFVATDYILNGNFANYGIHWAAWARLDNTIAYDYMGMRDKPKPGNKLLPPFGFCELYVGVRDYLKMVTNKHKFVCEMSQNILYQYCLLVLWWMMTIGIVVSVLGVLISSGQYAFYLLAMRRQGSSARKLMKAMSLRELEYMEYIRKKNLPLYCLVLQKLKEDRFGNKLEMEDYQGRNHRDNFYPSCRKDHFDEKDSV